MMEKELKVRRLSLLSA